jgi:hypothetical protein
MNKKLFFKFCLVAFLSFWQTASSYIFELRIYRDAKTGQIIILMGDWHDLGSKQENFEQCKKFEKIYKLLDNKKIYSRILFENMYAYTIDFSLHEKVKFELTEDPDKYKSTSAYYAPVDLDKLSFDQLYEAQLSSVQSLVGACTTWMGFELCNWILKNKSIFIESKSIDRRLVETFWESNCQALETLQEIDHLLKFRSLSLLLEKQYEGGTSSELKKILNEIYSNSDQEKFNEKVNQLSYNGKELAAFLSKSIGNVNSIFSKALEHEAMLFLFLKSYININGKKAVFNPSIEFLIAGGGHTHNIYKFMERLGFSLVKTFGISLEKLEHYHNNQTSSSTGEHWVGLSDELKSEMDLAFEYIYKGIDEKKVQQFDFKQCQR